MTKTLRHVAVLLLTTALIAALLWWSFHEANAFKDHVCGTCGYIYTPDKGAPEDPRAEGPPFAELPDDWTCPQCGSSKERFTPIEIWQTFDRIRWDLAFSGLLIGLLVFPLKAWRWQILLAPIRQVKITRLLSATMIGFMLNCILSRIGELARPAVLSIKGEVRMAAGLASIAIERVFDLCSIMLFLTLSLLLIQPVQSAEVSQKLALIRTTGIIAACLMVVGIVFLVLLRTHRKPMTRFVLACASWLPHRLKEKVQAFLESFLDGLDTLKSVSQVLFLIALSLVHWGCQILFFYLLGLCLPDFGLTLPGAMLVFALVALSVAALPLPGYLGVFQGAIKIAAIVLGLPAVTSLNYSWLAWAMNIPPIIVLGFIFLWLEGLTLGELRSGANRKAS